VARCSKEVATRIGNGARKYVYGLWELINNRQFSKDYQLGTGK